MGKGKGGVGHQDNGYILDAHMSVCQVRDARGRVVADHSAQLNHVPCPDGLRVGLFRLRRDPRLFRHVLQRYVEVGSKTGHRASKLQGLVEELAL